MATTVLEVRDVQQATPRARLITLDLGSSTFDFAAGQAVLAGLADSPLHRPYSIASSPTWSRSAHAIELLVQVDDHAAPDPHLERAIVGSRLRVEGPLGSFGLDWPIAERRLLLVAGGTGIAPLRSMLWETRARQPAVDIALIYTARSPGELAFAAELRGLARTGALELHLVVTRDADSPWIGPRRRVDAALIRSVVRTPDTRCLVCGPAGLVAEAMTWLAAAGIDASRIQWETDAR